MLVNDRDFCAVFVLFGCALILEGKLHIPKSSEVPVSTIKQETLTNCLYVSMFVCICVYSRILETVPNRTCFISVYLSLPHE